MVEILFEDIFTVTQLDPDGKKFDKVSRVEAVSQQFDMQMQLDVNTEIYPLSVGDKFTMDLAPTLNLDGTPDTGYFMQISFGYNTDIVQLWWKKWVIKQHGDEHKPLMDNIVPLKMHTNILENLKSDDLIHTHHQSMLEEKEREGENRLLINSSMLCMESCSKSLKSLPVDRM